MKDATHTEKQPGHLGKRRFAEPSNRILILSAPRTGSTALSLLLELAGLGHGPNEFLHWSECMKRNIDSSNALAHTRKIAMQRGTDTGYFTCKIHFSQFTSLFGPSPERGQEWLRYFNHFILIRRRDRLAQAISECFSMNSGLWNASANTDGPTTSFEYRDGYLPYVTKVLSRQILEEQGWLEALKQYKLNALDVCFEDLIADAAATMERVASHLGVELPEDFNARLPTRKISDSAAVEAFRSAYLKHLLTV